MILEEMRPSSLGGMEAYCQTLVLSVRMTGLRALVQCVKTVLAHAALCLDSFRFVRLADLSYWKHPPIFTNLVSRGTP